MEINRLFFFLTFFEPNLAHWVEPNKPSFICHKFPTCKLSVTINYFILTYMGYCKKTLH